MKRISYRIAKTGSPNNLRPIEEDIGAPGDKEVAVDIRAIGLNFADVFTVFGLYRAAPKVDFIPGIEFSGVVADRGKDVIDLQPGDRVMGSIRFGAYTTRINIDRSYVMKIPDEWSFEEGASFIVQALTAYYALRPLGNLKPKQSVLIHSAAGGVGIYANRIAKKFSAFTIGTVGSPAKAELIRSEGYDSIIVRGGDFVSRLTEALGGRELDLILDSVGGKVQKQSFRFLGRSGRMVAYGLSEFAPAGSRRNYFRLLTRFISMPRYATLNLIESNRSILGFNLIWLYDQVEVLRGMLGEIQALKLQRPFVGKVFPFEQLQDAFREFQSGKTVGKMVVRINNPAS